MFKITHFGYRYFHKKRGVKNLPRGAVYHMFIYFRDPMVFVIDGKEIRGDADTFIIFEKNVCQYYYSEQESYRSDFIHFEGEELREYLTNLQFPMNYPLRCTDKAMYEQIYSAICQEYVMKFEDQTDTNPKVHDNNLDTLMRTLFLSLSCKSAALIKVNSKIDFRFLEIRNHIYENPGSDWAVEGLAQESGFSNSYFKYLYKNFFGVPISDDITKSRMLRASNLLTKTSLKAETVSELCGYHNYEHFSRRFKCFFGFSPSNYRESQEIRAKTDTVFIR